MARAKGSTPDRPELTDSRPEDPKTRRPKSHTDPNFELSTNIFNNTRIINTRINNTRINAADINQIDKQQQS